MQDSRSWDAFHCCTRKWSSPFYFLWNFHTDQTDENLSKKFAVAVFGPCYTKFRHLQYSGWLLLSKLFSNKTSNPVVRFLWSIFKSKEVGWLRASMMSCPVPFVSQITPHNEASGCACPLVTVWPLETTHKVDSLRFVVTLTSTHYD